MKVVVRCPNGHSFTCNRESLGLRVNCPRSDCGQSFVLREAEATALADTGVRLRCPACQTVVASEASACSACGARLGAGASRHPAPVESAPSCAAENPPLDSTAGDEDKIEEMLAALAVVRRRRRLPDWSPFAVGAVLALLLLVVSVAFGANAVRVMIVLVAIAVVHDGGKAIAMRIVGRHDAGWSFLPIFRSAVNALSPAAPGWRQCVIVLAGPALSIVVGFALILASAAAVGLLLTVMGGALVVLAAFALCPIWWAGYEVLNTTVFQRSAAGEFGARLAAAAACVGAWFAFEFWWLIAGGAYNFIHAFWVLRTRRLARDVAEAIAPDTADQPLIPRRHLCAILPMFRRRFSTLGDSRLLAALIDGAWQRARQKPPGLRATIGVLAAYVALWALVVGTLLFSLRLMANDVVPSPQSGWLAEYIQSIREADREREGNSVHELLEPSGQDGAVDDASPQSQ